MRGLFVTGTDTDVGKTYVSTMILRELVAAGVRVGISKPACSGAVSDGDNFRWPDLDELAAAAGITNVDWICSQRFRAPLAPPVAARLERRPIRFRTMQDELQAWSTRAEIVIVEGVGGLLCPLTDDHSVADFASWTGFPLIVVARLGLGTINHTLLTIEAARHRHLEIAGVIVNDADNLCDSPAGQTNMSELAARTDIPVLGMVAFGSQTACLRDRETPARIDWSKLAAGRNV